MSIEVEKNFTRSTMLIRATGKARATASSEAVAPTRSSHAPPKEFYNTTPSHDTGHARDWRALALTQKKNGENPRTLSRSRYKNTQRAQRCRYGRAQYAL